MITTKKSVIKMDSISAAILVIGNEILSGRTQDKNVNYLAKGLLSHGISLSEVRIIGDIHSEIVMAVNELRNKFDYVFTTGGIGSTHDDITTDAIASAFGIKVEENKTALSMLEEHYAKVRIDFNKTRRRMARIPIGASLIENKVSIAPGYRLDNVYVMAGIPRVMQSMFSSVLKTLKGARKLSSVSIGTNLGEGDIGSDLALLQNRFADIMIGSYPFFKDGGGFGVNIVMQGYDSSRLSLLAKEVEKMLAIKKS